MKIVITHHANCSTDGKLNFGVILRTKSQEGSLGAEDSQRSKYWSIVIIYFLCYSLKLARDIILAMNWLLLSSFVVLFHFFKCQAKRTKFPTAANTEVSLTPSWKKKHLNGYIKQEQSW